MKESPLKNKSYDFAIQIVKLCQSIQSEKKEYVLSRQILRSGTAIGALIREAEFGQSVPDFIHKLSVALKEANETDYWLNILKDTGYMSDLLFKNLNSNCAELIAMLISSIKTSKKKIKLNSEK
jgi:four helix bundle protein